MFSVAIVELSPMVIADEEQRTVYYGDTGANSIINHLRYSDVSATSWAKEAIYETGALGILKGYRDANGRFGRTVPITKGEAVAVVDRATGREAGAEQLGRTTNNNRTQANKKTDPL